MTNPRAYRHLGLVTGLFLCFALGSPQAGATPSAEASRDAWVAQASVGLPPPVLEALSKIAGADRQLLALRSYLKAGSGLADRWSWSLDQQSRYSSTLEGKAASVELDAVVAAFAAENPGFSVRAQSAASKPGGADRELEWQRIGPLGRCCVRRRCVERRFGAERAQPNATALRKALLTGNPIPARGRSRPGAFRPWAGARLRFSDRARCRVDRRDRCSVRAPAMGCSGMDAKAANRDPGCGNAFGGPAAIPIRALALRVCPGLSPDPVNPVCSGR